MRKTAEKKRRFLILTALLAIMSVTALCAGALAEKTLTFTFAGDCTLGSEESKRGAANSFVSTYYEKGPDYFMANFRSLFEQDDWTIVNLECVFSDNRADEKTSKRYRFRGDLEFVKILTGSSVEAVGLANNHTGDYGNQGIRHTKETLEENSIAWFMGTEPVIFEKDGIHVAFYAVDNMTVYNKGEELRKSMDTVRENGQADAIIMMYHCGTEYDPRHNVNQENMAKVYIAHGADLIVMHHPHVLQGIRIANNRSVFYSLGNFTFGGNDRIKEKLVNTRLATSLYTMVLQARLRFSDDGEYLGQQMTVIPGVTTSAEPPINDFRPRLATEEEAVQAVAAIQTDTDFDLPLLTEEDGIWKMVMPYLPARYLPTPESPEPAPAAPSRETKGE